MPTVAAAPSTEQLADWKRDFTAAMPKMKRVFDFRLRHLHGNRRDEAEADALFFAWQDYRSLCCRGIDPQSWIQKIAQYAALGATSARKSQSVNELLSRAAREQHGHTVQSLDEGDDGELSPEVADALADRKSANPADEAVARVHFQDWLDGLDDEQREKAEEFGRGMNNTEVGQRHGRGRGSGSAWRRELRKSWQEFDGERKR